jgi:hypothetical protein
MISLVVTGRAFDQMIRMEERLFHELADVVAFSCIEHPRTVTAHPDEPGEAQLGQMLRHRGRLRSDMGGQFVDRMLAVQKRPENAQAGVVRQELEGLDGKIDLFVCRLPVYLRSHAIMLPRARKLAVGIRE